MSHLTAENTTAIGHRVAGDSLMFECPNCEFGEVPIQETIESGAAACLDCGTRYELHVEEAPSG